MSNTDKTPQEVVLEFLDKSGTYFLATIGEDGKPAVRPFGAHFLEDDRIYLVTANDKAVYRELKADPRLQICACHPNGSKWMRITAEAEFHEGEDAEALQAKMLEAKPPLKKMYAVGDGLMAIFALRHVTANFKVLKYDAKERPVSYE